MTAPLSGAIAQGTTDEIQDLKVENALLRGSLFLAARALKTYHDSPHFEIDDEGVEKMEVIVPTEAVHLERVLGRS